MSHNNALGRRALICAGSAAAAALVSARVSSSASPAPDPDPDITEMATRMTRVEKRGGASQPGRSTSCCLPP